jgi:hypothetical protein
MDMATQVEDVIRALQMKLFRQFKYYYQCDEDMRRKFNIKITPSLVTIIDSIRKCMSNDNRVKCHIDFRYETESETFER